MVVITVGSIIVSLLSDFPIDTNSSVTSHSIAYCVLVEEWMLVILSILDSLEY